MKKIISWLVAASETNKPGCMCLAGGGDGGESRRAGFLLPGVQAALTNTSTPPCVAANSNFA